MNRRELVADISERTGISRKDSEKALQAFVDSIVDALVAGEKVALVGFGTFQVRERKERKGRNPRTEQVITIPAGRVPTFKPGKQLKVAVRA